MQREGLFKKILIPSDGSLPSLIALELAAFMVKKLKSNVTVMHVVSHEFMSPQLQKLFAERDKSVITGFDQEPIITEPGPASQSTLLPDEISDEISEWYHQKGSEIIADAAALFKEEGIPVDQKLVERADPAEAILREAKDGNYDLIVIGHSGEEEQESHLGSVAEKVSRHAQTPVLIARKKRHISKMLVPVDGSEISEKALRYAVLLAKRIDAEMTLLHVQESGLFKLRPEVAKAIGTRILSKAVSQAKGVKIVQKLESGDPAKIVIQTAKNGDYDLIVMGSKGHSGLGRFLLGSVSDHVIHYADRSVLLTK